MAIEPVRHRTVREIKETAPTIKYLRLSLAQIKDLANLSTELGPLSCAAWHNYFMSALEKMFVRHPDFPINFGTVEGFFRFFTQPIAPDEDIESKLSVAGQFQFQFDKHVGEARQQPREGFAGWAQIFVVLKILSLRLGHDPGDSQAIANAKDNCRSLIDYNKLPLEIEITE